MGATLFSRWRHTSRPAHKTPPQRSSGTRITSEELAERKSASVFLWL